MVNVKKKRHRRNSRTVGQENGAGFNCEYLQVVPLGGMDKGGPADSTCAIGKECLDVGGVEGMYHLGSDSSLR